MILFSVKCDLQRRQPMENNENFISSLSFVRVNMIAKGNMPIVGYTYIIFALTSIRKFQT